MKCLPHVAANFMKTASGTVTDWWATMDFLPFFVYGTLLPGQPNYYYWGDAILAMETAVFPNGRLYDLGSYPMLIEAEGGSVTGAVITVDQSQYHAILTRLDQLEEYDPEQPEQSSYIRAKRAVQLPDGRIQTAWVYIGQWHFQPSLPVIKNGDWVEHSTSKHAEINEWWLTASQLHKTPDKR